MLFALTLLILIGCVASMYGAGVWTNSLTLLATIFSALLAMNYFEPVADWIQAAAPSWEYLADFVALWALFAVSVLLLRWGTDLLSKLAVPIHPQVDLFGGILLAAVIGWHMICFATASLHVAALPRTALGGAFMETPDSKMLVFTPDRIWLGWFHRQSTAGPLKRYHAVPFDARGDFVYKYAYRRHRLDNSGSLFGN